MRVVSLLPSATEILFRILHRQPGGTALGAVQLVGRSHECDYPPGDVDGVPILTSQHTKFTTPKDVDDQVRTALKEGKSLYSVDIEKLKALAPDVILTQSLCNVCSIDVNLVHKIVATMGKPPKVVSLNPYTLNEVLDSLVQVGEALNLVGEALEEKKHLAARVERCKSVVAVNENIEKNDETSKTRKNVAFIEWTDPLYVGGHWTPELINMAGGYHSINPNIGVKSFVISPEELVKNDPDVCIICPCGLDLDETTNMVRLLQENEWWWQLRAVTTNSVCLVDGNQMFNRPGPRLVDCLEWLTWYLNTPSTQRTASPLKSEKREEFPWRRYIPSKEKYVKNQMRKPSEITKSALDTTYINSFHPEIEEAHRIAMDNGQKTYIDPETGYSVFTELASRERGYCCGRGCRHCTYGHWNVPAADKRKNKISQPTLLRAQGSKKRWKEMNRRYNKDILHVLFWSGGKDSFMALLHLMEMSKNQNADTLPPRIILLTTFDPQSGNIPEQEIKITEATDQVKALGLDLDFMACPLPSSCSNDVYIDVISKVLTDISSKYEIPKAGMQLVFGDLHLEDIKKWREDMFSEYKCLFPIFNEQYSKLCKLLFGSTLLDRIEVSNVTVESDLLSVGMTFDKNVYAKLKESDANIDPFGELGEFHTKCVFRKSSSE